MRHLCVRAQRHRQLQPSPAVAFRLDISHCKCSEGSEQCFSKMMLSWFKLVRGKISHPLGCCIAMLIM